MRRKNEAIVDTCQHCAGSGEGPADGTRCLHCSGKGEYLTGEFYCPECDCETENEVGPCDSCLNAEDDSE